MNKTRIQSGLLFIWVIIGFYSCGNQMEQMTITSPNSKIAVQVMLSDGQLLYSLTHNGEPVVSHSKLGYNLKGMSPLGTDMKIAFSKRNSKNTTWEQVWGEKRLIENRYEELRISLIEKNGLNRHLNVIFRVFDDGIAFRYHIPKQENIDSTFIIMDELTQFNIPEVKTAWWIPAYKETFYESLYRNTPLSEIDTVCVPLTMELNNGTYLAIHEANLTDYAAMNLYCTNSRTLEVDLTPWSTGEKVFAEENMYSPWRTITIADKPGDLITSYISLNLNEPNKIKDTSWIKPGKYIGIWWSIHMGEHTWSQGPKHGATTKNTKAYIDFAAKNGFDGVLVEGWNKGWDFDWVTHGDSINFIEAYADFDIEEIARYGKANNVALIGHHETGGATINYESQLEEAFELYQNMGVSAVKTGYVSLNKLDGKEYHSSQYGVRHYRKVIETAAKYKIMIDNHEPVMPTGLQRTYPNLMTQEGVRGQEYNAWSKDGGNPPEHTTVIPFTRGLAGPMDFTFGTFDFSNSKNPGTRVQTTIAKQLGLYVVIYSPLQMASDLPKNYANKKEFDFIKSVPVDWSETKVLDGEIGEYIITVRKDKFSDDWYLGAITNENKREIMIDLSFLDKNRTYRCEIYKDGDQAHWETNPLDFQYIEKEVQADDSMILHMANGGGQAIRFTPVKP